MERRSELSRGGLLAAGLAVVLLACPHGGDGKKTPGVPQGVTAAAGTSEIALTWIPVQGATTHNIYWSTIPGVTPDSGNEIADVTPPYRHWGLTNGTTYHYIVTALQSTGARGQSAEAMAMPLAAPSGLTALEGDTEVTLDWAAVTGASQYDIYWRATPVVTKANGNLIGDVTPAYTHGGLRNRTAYSYVVVARNSVGGGAESIESSEVSATPHPSPVGTVHSITGFLGNLIYDFDRDRVYIANRTANMVEIFDVAQAMLLAPLPVGPDPWGLDITPDGSKLLVCPTGASRIDVVDLTVDPPTLGAPVPVPPDSVGASWPFDIGCAENGLALFSLHLSGSGWVELGELDLSTWSIRYRPDVPPSIRITDDAIIATSGDRSHIVIAQVGISSGPYFVYSAASDSFSEEGELHSSLPGAAANATGTRFAILAGPTFVDRNARVRGRAYYGMGTSPWGFVFAPASNLAYGGLRFEPDIAVIDTDRALVIDWIGAPADITGDLTINPAGTVIYGIGDGGLLEVPIQANRPPILEPLGTGTVNVGETIGVILHATDSNLDPSTFSAGALPPNGTFDPGTGLFQFSPDASQAGMTYEVSFSATDGAAGSSQTFRVTVTDPPSYPARKIPIQGTLREGIYDPVTGNLYITNSSMHRVEVIRVADNTRLDPIPVGSRPWGIDMDLAGTRLVVCASMTDFLQIIDLGSSPLAVSQDLEVFALAPRYRRPLTIGVAANDLAIVGPWHWSLIGGVDLSDLDLNTGLGKRRTDAPGASQAHPILMAASGDRSLIFLGTGGRVYFYDPGTDAFSADAVSTLAYQIDANGVGDRFIAGVGFPPRIRVYDQTLAMVGSHDGNQRYPAFRKGFAEAFMHDQTTTVDVLDLGSYTITRSFDLPEPAAGWMGTDESGSLLFAITQTGICIVDLP